MRLRALLFSVFFLLVGLATGGMFAPAQAPSPSALVDFAPASKIAAQVADHYGYGAPNLVYVAPETLKTYGVYGYELPYGEGDPGIVFITVYREGGCAIWNFLQECETPDGSE